MADGNGRMKILVLEDEPSLVMVYRRLFGSVADRVDITYVNNPIEAEVLFDEGYSPNHIITDQGMPNMYGDAYIRLLREQRKFTGRIVLASATLDNRLVGAVSPFGVPCVNKPFRGDVMPNQVLRYFETGEPIVEPKV